MRRILWWSPSFAYSMIPLLNKLISIPFVWCHEDCHHTWWQIPSFTMCMQSRAGRLQAHAPLEEQGIVSKSSLPLLSLSSITFSLLHFLFILFNSFPSLLILFAQIPDMFYCKIFFAVPVLLHCNSSYSISSLSKYRTVITGFPPLISFHVLSSSCFLQWQSLMSCKKKTLLKF